MNKEFMTLAFLFLATLSTSVLAGTPPPGTPEIDTGSALLGLGLLAGIIGLVTELRRK